MPPLPSAFSPSALSPHASVGAPYQAPPTVAQTLTLGLFQGLGVNRRVAAAILAIVVLGAGCVGGPSDGTPTTESTAQPPDASSPTGTTGPGPTADYPTGFGPNGVTNASAAASAHADALLASGGYTASFDVTRTGDADRRGAFRWRVDLDDRQVLTSVERENARYLQFYEDGTVYENVTQDGVSTYRSRNASIPLSGTTGRSTVAQLLGGVEYGAAERVEDGFRYRSERLVAADGLVGTERTNVSSFAATVIVGDNGVVRSIEYETTYTVQGNRTTVSASLTTTIDETDVERPSWTSKA